MKYLLSIIIIISFISCSDSGNHYRDPWDMPEHENEKSYMSLDAPPKDTVTIKHDVKS